MYQAAEEKKNRAALESNPVQGTLVRYPSAALLFHLSRQ